MPVSRRSFIKHSAAATAALSAGLSTPLHAAETTGLKPGPCNKWPGRVAINFNKNAVENLSTPKVDIIKKMVDDAIKALTGKDTVGEAWKELFPATLSLQSKIAIKTNTVNTSLPGPHWASVRAITDGLQQISIGGTTLPAANITIYDMDFQGGMSKLNYTAANFPGITIEYTRLADGGDGALSNHKYSQTLKNSDFLINVFSPRGHSTEYLPIGSRFTLGFKSHIGTYASEASKEGPSLHPDLPKNLREMNCSGPVYTKTVLSFCSGIFGMNEGNGPPGDAQDFKTYAKTMDASITSSVNPTTIIMGTDPVSVEMQAIKMIRLNKSGKYGIDDLPPYLQASAGISGKLDGATYNIGIIDEAKMDIRRVINDVVSTSPPLRGTLQNRASDLSLRLHSSSGTTLIECTLPEKAQGSAEVEIVTLSGAHIRSFKVTAQGVRNQFSWNNRSSNGSRCSSGMYIARLNSENSSISKQFMIP